MSVRKETVFLHSHTHAQTLTKLSVIEKYRYVRLEKTFNRKSEDRQFRCEGLYQEYNARRSTKYQLRALLVCVIRVRVDKPRC